jgi:hypothetical protein
MATLWLRTSVPERVFLFTEPLQTTIKVNITTDLLEKW